MSNIISNREPLNKEAFLKELAKKVQNVNNNPQEYENIKTSDFLEAFHSWLEDSDGFYLNIGEPSPKIDDWRPILDMISAALIYE